MCQKMIYIAIFYSHFFHSLLVYDKTFYLQVYLSNCVHKLGNKQLTDDLYDNLILEIRSYKCCIMIELI